GWSRHQHGSEAKERNAQARNGGSSISQLAVALEQSPPFFVCLARPRWSPAIFARPTSGRNQVSTAWDSDDLAKGWGHHDPLRHVSASHGFSEAENRKQGRLDSVPGRGTRAHALPACPFHAWSRTSEPSRLST